MSSELNLKFQNIYMKSLVHENFFKNLQQTKFPLKRLGSKK
jgi:hypothetical protein